MFNQYYDDWEIKPQFEKENISLWSGWLGKENYHLLDVVTEKEWSRFNSLILMISQSFKLGIADRNMRTVSFPANISSTFSNYSDSMNKDSSLFSQYVLPEMECVITEEWDYTYILWHKNNGAVERLSPYIRKSKLRHYSKFGTQAQFH